jgi:hypothetical protein
MNPNYPWDSVMVVAVQCPNPICRKYMLVEERDCAKVVVCLLCKTPFQLDVQHLESAHKRIDEPAKPNGP